MAIMIGTIYKIIHAQSDICYVGSTLNKELKQRWKSHKQDYRKWSNDETKAKCSIYPFFKQFGVDSFKMVLIKECEVVDRTHLEAYEALWVSKLTCVNRNVPFFIKKLYHKQYREANHKKIQQQREDNRENILEYKKHYYDVNRDEIIKKGKEYRQANGDAIKAKRNEKFSCECGGRHTRAGRSEHFKTKKHTNWQATQ